MVKFNNTQEKTYNIIRWEGGTQNHIFNGQHVQNQLQEENTKMFIKKKMNNQVSESSFKIGTFQGNKRLYLAGSAEGENLPENVSKCVILYDQS